LLFIGTLERATPEQHPTIHNFCNFFRAGDKCFLSGYVNWLSDKYGATGNNQITEESFILSNQGRLNEAKKEEASAWILKECWSNNRDGLDIRFNANFSSLPEKRESWIAQRYILNPVLYEGRKFHFRVYLFVPNWKPFRAFVQWSYALVSERKFIPNAGEPSRNFSFDANVHLSMVKWENGDVFSGKKKFDFFLFVLSDF
jgi:hypothetical protein